jgi:hypothetical protein
MESFAKTGESSFVSDKWAELVTAWRSAQTESETMRRELLEDKYANYRSGSDASTNSRIQILDRIPYCVETGRRYDGFLGEDPEPVCSVCTGTSGQQRERPLI